MGEIRENQSSKIIFDENGNSTELLCIVKEIFSDRISLTLPKGYMKYVDFLDEGVEIKLEIYTPSGTKFFNSIILNSPLESEFVVEFDEEDSKQPQRRNFTRSFIETDIIVYPEDNPDAEAICKTIDISGGSVRFKTTSEFKQDQIVVAKLFLPPEETPVQFKGKCHNNGNLKSDECVIIFTDISDVEQNRIIKKCFEIEAALYNE